MSEHRPSRVREPFFSAGTYVLMALMGIGYSFGLARFLTGLSAITNLSNSYPWGIWIAIDVACGVALAAGGFTTAALVDIFGKEKFKPLLRPAILTAWLGYAFVGLALAFDLGRYWNGWRPIFFWQGNSVLFEVGMCVMIYLTVLTVEMGTPLLEGFQARIANNEWGAPLLRRVERPILFAHRLVKAVLPLFIIAGVVLSCMHQSSLGTLMVIAPTKLHSLWYTPWLPVLFLLSAIMVGFPMVILESIFASRALGREPELELLGPLGRSIRYFIGLYALVRIAVLIGNWENIEWLGHPTQLTAFIVEMTVGVVLPLLLFSSKRVRQSAGWLFFSALLVVLGVVLNRVNVFLVGYQPPFDQQGYFPSVGEIALTTGIVATIIFLYRVFIFAFPVITGPGGEFSQAAREKLIADPVSPRLAWGLRTLGAATLLVFVGLYSLVHTEAISGEIRAFGWVGDMEPVAEEGPVLTRSEHSFRPEGYLRVYQLESPILNARVNYYEPVRFSHISHDVLSGGDCSVCHHRWTDDPEDRIGYDLAEMHQDYDVNLGGPCASCHDMEEIEIVSCASCHWHAGEKDDTFRLGLKGAYHQQCIDCHEASGGGEKAPTDCNSCHHPNTPDHSKLIELGSGATPSEVTARCLECHEQAGHDILKTAHWNWQGHSPEVCGHEHSNDLGLTTLVNNHTFSAGINKEFCASCHIGFQFAESEYGKVTMDPNQIDCLICHDTTGTYAKSVEGGGLPAAEVNLLEVAQHVGRPSRRNCGLCHFNSGGGPNVKHGDLEPMLADPPDEFDVHMGMYDMRCQDCHRTREHRIAGLSLSAPAVEGRVHCSDCHGEAPHGIAGIAGHHLDDHVRSIACETCHIPVIAKGTPTRVFIDFSKVGSEDDCEEGLLDEASGPFRIRMRCAERWGSKLVPTYLWHDGRREAHLLGDPVDPDETLIMNRLLGERRSPNAKIHPFKVHEANQPYDAKTRQLVVPLLVGGLWEHGNWERAISEGMEKLGRHYSGQHAFLRTRQYSGVHHTVVPAKYALTCTNCHEWNAVDCSRCHAGVDMEELPESMLAKGREPRLDFEALGYEGDPAWIGGRFLIGPGKGRPR